MDTHMLDRNNEVIPIPPDLLALLANTPPERVIDTIEALDPPPNWKNDLVPWRCRRENEPIPWQTVYCLYQTPLTAEELEWAQRIARENGWID